MKKFFIIGIILFLAAACAKQPSVSVKFAPTAPPLPIFKQDDATAGWQTYTNTLYGFSIKYPEDFALASDPKNSHRLTSVPLCDPGAIECLEYIGKAFQGTNFEGAGIGISVPNQKEALTEKDCYAIAAASGEIFKLNGINVINGLTFHLFTGGGAAAGHWDGNRQYRIFYNHLCYTINARISASNIDVYQPGTVKEFDENAVWAKLLELIKTFQFTH